MKRSVKIVLVGMVAVILVLAYFAFVGVAQGDWNGDDPTGQDRDPIAYASVYYNVGVKNEYDRFASKVYELSVDVYNYDTNWEARVYPNIFETLNGWFADDAKLRAKFEFSGPGNVLFTEYTDWVEVNIPEWSITYTHLEFNTPKVLFYDEGPYKVTGSLYIECDEFTGLLPGATTTTSFVVGY